GKGLDGQEAPRRARAVRVSSPGEPWGRAQAAWGQDRAAERGWTPRVVLLVHAGLLAERFPLVQHPKGQLDEHRLVAALRGTPDVALRQVFQHAEALHSEPGIDELFREPGDRHVPGRIPELPVLTGRADQLLLLPVPEHARGDPDVLGDPGDRHELR